MRGVVGLVVEVQRVVVGVLIWVGMRAEGVVAVAVAVAVVGLIVRGRRSE